MRQWDVLTANRVDYFIANSQNTASHLALLPPPATVIYPPVNIERFPFNLKTRFLPHRFPLVSYKQVSLIVGLSISSGSPSSDDGTRAKEIRKLAQSNVQVLGTQPDYVVEKYMAQKHLFMLLVRILALPQSRLKPAAHQ